jgi:AraC-like DNA-binding protein
MVRSSSRIIQDFPHPILQSSEIPPCQGTADVTDRGISDIAYSLNFQNVSQFSTFFSKKEGLSPSEYRKN